MLLLLSFICSSLLARETVAQNTSEATGAAARFPANLPGDTSVYYGGGPRSHVKGCRRLTKDPAELAKMTKMTLAEAEAKGLWLCSRCPGSTVAGKGNPEVKAAAKSDSTAPGKENPEGGGSGLPRSWVKPGPAEITQVPFVPSPLAPLVSLGPDGRLVYRAYSKQGDRLMDWSQCGYRNSSVPIPDVPVAVTLEPLSGEAKAIGNMAYPMGPDSRKRIQEALDQVAAMAPNADGSRGAVLLKKGTYYLGGGLTVRSGVVLRGEGDGEDGTVLIMSSARGGLREDGDAAILLGEPKGKEDPVGEADCVRIADAYVPSGSLTLTLAKAGGFKVGDFVHVRKTVNRAWIDLLGMGERLQHIRGGGEGAGKRPWVPGAYSLRHLRRIVAMDGNRITLDAVLPQSFDKQHGGGDVYKVEVDSLARHAGVESLRVVSNYDTSVKDDSKSTNFLNFHSGIVIQAAHDSWVRRCTIKHVTFAAVGIGPGTRQITVRDTRCLAPVGPKRGGYRYAFSIAGGTLHLVYNCHAEDNRHDFAIGSKECGPFAFVKCTAVRGGQSEPHHRWSTGILYDNVVTKDGTLAAINRGDSGSGHGWAAANTMFWNCDAKSIVVFDPETEGENNFAIGYRGIFDPATGTGALRYANDRAGYWGTPQEGKFHGHALMGSGHIESPDRPVTPDSLFVQQLIERIGKERADAVLK
jgi:hypothetical protein